MPKQFLTAALAEAADAGLKRWLRPVERCSARTCRVEGRICLNFSANDYLALADDSRLKAAAMAWTERFGTGAGASRLVTGTSPAILELEQELATWKGTESALLLGSGFLANLGAIAALADGREDAVLADRLNHASLHAGSRLGGAKLHRYRHLDLGHLAELLAQVAPARRRLVVSDTVFSMDGDLADPAALAALARRHQALLYLDEAHATGVFGERGEGLSGLHADLVMGTFSKAMGGYGAYLAGSRETCEYLVNRCAPFIFSTALPPGVCGAIQAAVALVQTPEFCEIRTRLLVNSRRVASELRNLGFQAGDGASPIIPVMVGEAAAAVRSSQLLLEQGILAVAIRPPTVPAGAARLRLSLNAAHTEADLDHLLAACAKLRLG